ncbi:MAG: hypothetical protein FI675_05260 [SAR202 cluster bacterium]|nr:hypothetical protein [SAR202 cluster bacterium]
MKLSVKLLSGLMLLALVTVAIISTDNTASAAADGKVYVTNKASNLTTEGTGKPTARKTATAVYGTYASVATTGITARDIVSNSDKFIVTVIDADVNSTTTVTSKATGGNTGFDLGLDNNHAISTSGTAQVVADFGGSGGAGLDEIGDIVTVTLDDTKASPIIGSTSDIKITVASPAAHAGKTVSGVTVHQIVNDGSASASTPAVIQVRKSAAGADVDGALIGWEFVNITYPSSNADTLTVTLKSVVDPTGAVMVLTETGRNTGRFEGEVQLIERTDALATVKINSAPAGVTQVAGVDRVPVIGGPVTVEYQDAATSGTATNVKRTATYNVDNTVPSVTITTPADGGQSQNRLPSFTGSAADSQSGLDISTFSLRIDRTDDPTNTTMVIAANGTPGGTPANIDTTTLGSDGATSISWSYTESTALPTMSPSTETPNNEVDFQASVMDLAGNVGYSDAKTSGTGADDAGTGRNGNQPHVIKIDQKTPSISSAVTGTGWDTSASPAAEKADASSIKVTMDGKIDSTSVAPSDIQVVFSNSGGTHVPTAIDVKDSVLYLKLDTTIPSNNKPTVQIKSGISDLAGNSANSGSKVATDGIKPVVTMVTSGGSGTGTGSEAADSLTKDKMTITVTSDENLNGPPKISVRVLTSPNQVGLHTETLGVPLGGNQWKLVVSKGAASTGDVAVKVESTDTTGNLTTKGDITTKVYRLDTALSAPTSTPANSGTITVAKPFITTDYSANETATVSITKATMAVGSAAAVDVTADVVASADGLVFFYQPTDALTNAKHTYVVKAKDAAGNTHTQTVVFTKSDRKDYVLDLFAGWNLVSLPSDPTDTAVGSVFSNTGIKQVVSYDATSPSSPWRIASQVDGSFSSQTDPGLDHVYAGPGYWVETSDFENQTVSLSGPTGPGDSRPALTTIATGSGWNLVGVVDQSRVQTQKSDNGTSLVRTNQAGSGVAVTVQTYFDTVSNSRQYAFDTVTSKFRALVDANEVKIGDGMWVYIQPQANGLLPHIVP